VSEVTIKELSEQILALDATASAYKARVEELEGELRTLRPYVPWPDPMLADRDRWRAIAERLGEALRLSARGANPDTGIVLRALDEMKEGAKRR
jgi:hypothetical protein